jgi:hypothetical protein
MFREIMKQAIKVLAKQWKIKKADFDNCEMVSDHDFLQNNLENIELEIIELQKAIKFINDNVV